jgi:hypothetical protein
MLIKTLTEWHSKRKVRRFCLGALALSLAASGSIQTVCVHAAQTRWQRRSRSQTQFICSMLNDALLRKLFPATSCAQLAKLLCFVLGTRSPAEGSPSLCNWLICGMRSGKLPCSRARYTSRLQLVIHHCVCCGTRAQQRRSNADAIELICSMLIKRPEASDVLHVGIIR